MKLTQGLIALFTATLLCSSFAHAAGLTIDLEAEVTIEEIEHEAESASPLAATSLIPVYKDSTESFEPKFVLNDIFEMGDFDGDGDQDIAYPDKEIGFNIVYNKTVDGGEPHSAMCMKGGVSPKNGTEFIDIAIADFNEDSKLDAVTVTRDGEKYIYMNIGDEEVYFDDLGDQPFYIPCFISYKIGWNQTKTSSVDVGDVNRDGLPDLVFGHVGATNELYLSDITAKIKYEDDEHDVYNPRLGERLLYGSLVIDKGGVSGDEPLQQSISTEAFDTVNIKLADINNDGYLDVVTLSENTLLSAPVKVIYHNKTLEPYNSQSIVKYLPTQLGTPNGLSIADFDQDGDSDIIVTTNAKDPNFYLFKANSRYQFSMQRIQKPFSGDISAISSSDVNKDGYPDLTVSFNDIKGNQKNLTQVYLNNRGEYPFSSAVGINVSSSNELYGRSVAVTDINNDNSPDIVMVNDLSAEYTFFDHLKADETPPSVEITGTANNATILPTNKYHRVVIEAADQTGISSALVRIFKKESDGSYGAPQALIDKRDGELESHSSSFNLAVSADEEYKLEVVVTDMSGNSYTDSIEYQYTDKLDLVDSDGDQIPDQWEAKHGYDKFDPLDATKDDDEDGLSNVEEFIAKTDPIKKDTDSDSYTDLEEIINNTDPIKADIKPLADFPLDRYVDEGTEVQVDVYLSDIAPVYPAIIDVEIDGASTAQQGVDFELDTQRLVINEGRKGTLKFTIADDGVAEGRENIVLKMTDVTHVLSGVKNEITLTIVEENIAPVADLNIQQSGRVSRIVHREHGPVTMTVNPSDVNAKDTHSVAWRFSDELGVVDILPNNNSASFDPGSVEPGIYVVEAVVTDSGSPSLAVTVAVELKVVEKVNSVSELLDDDNNGIANEFDLVTESHQLVVAEGLGVESLVATSPGLKLSIGATALAGSARGAKVSLQEIESYMSEKTTMSLTDEITNIGGYYDFDVSGLTIPGMTVDIVIPLNTEVPKDAVYRKFNPASGWTDFVENSENRISSAKAENGVCPPAGSNKYGLGLIPFTQCVQLSIEDGGPNDMDGMVNSVIKDPGGVATDPEVEAEKKESPTASTPASGGGGSSDWFLFAVILMCALGRKRFLVTR